MHAFVHTLGLARRDGLKGAGLVCLLNEQDYDHLTVVPLDYSALSFAEGARQGPNAEIRDEVWGNLSAMNRAAEHLLGQHDFASFCRRASVPVGRPEQSLVRILQRAAWHRVDDSLVRFEIAASSFCHQMVRSIVGTLVEVGQGRREVDSIPASLAALDRNAAGRVAPPTGLVLWDVGFDGTRWDA